MYSFFIEPFVEYDFMLKAFLACVIMSFSAPILGVFLNLKKLSLSCDAISHAILPGIAIGYSISGLSLLYMSIGGIIAGSLVVIISSYISRITIKDENNSLAAFYIISLAFGIFVISISGNNLDLLSILFGTLLSVNLNNIFFLITITLITIIVLTIIRRPFIIDCVDPLFLKNLKINGNKYHTIFLILVVINLIACFQAFGTLMSVGILILPSTITRYWYKDLKITFISVSIITLLSCYFGLLLSYNYNYPTTPIIIILLGFMYVISLFIGKNSGIIKRFLKVKHLES